MKKIILFGVPIILGLLGVIGGLGLGSFILSKTTVVRADDWLGCMVGLPATGLIVFWFIGAVISDHLDSFFWRIKKRKESFKIKVDTPAQFLVFGHTDNGRGTVVEVTALNGAEALKKAKQERPNCKFNHVNLK